MPPRERRSRLEHAERLGIEFLDPIEPEEWPPDWPEARRHLFRDIKTLGGRDFHGYHNTATSDVNEKPWRGQVKRKAVRLAFLARRGRKEGRNEPSWRGSLEPEVFHRFTVEVSCPTCRDRLWRSEIEAAIESTETQVLPLEERRKQRKPCRCPQESEQLQHDHGINMIFSDRLQTSIHHEQAIPFQSGGKSGKKYEQPDRVYGLYQTENFKMLLNLPDKRLPHDGDRRFLRHTLNVTPYKSDLEPLLFPFILVEAKSDTVGDAAGVDLQSAFSLRRLLLLQEELRAATESETVWRPEPMVWYFSYHGYYWRVGASFVDTIHSSSRYRILQLWHGDIRQHSDALQLLLIVDYIFDWARDGYRPFILHALNILAGQEMELRDPDILSTNGRRESRLTSELPSFSQNSFFSQPLDAEGFIIPDFLPSMDPRYSLGIVRYASNMESRCLALHLTLANVDDFWRSFISSQVATVAVHTIVKNLSSSWKVTAETLSSMEAKWTDSDSWSREGHNVTEQIFHVKIVILLHVAEDWQLVRQLTYLAISEGALDVLVSRAASPTPPATSLQQQNDLHSAPIVERNKLEAFITSILRQSIASNLTAAVSMLCLSSNSWYHRPSQIPGRWLLKKSYNNFAGFAQENSPFILELISRIADLHGAIGKTETAIAQSCCVRFSRRQDPMSQDGIGLVKSKMDPDLDLDLGLDLKPEPLMWPRLDPICQDRNGCALVEALNPQTNVPRHCLYIITRHYVGDADVPSLVESLSESGLYYATQPIGSSSRPLGEEYFPYLNRPVTVRDELWKDAESLSSVKEWIEGLRSQPELPGEVGDTFDSPIVISSSEESDFEGDLMGDEGDWLMRR
ncbi:hypothetical protein BDV06DRAFT_188256 [Aspergillus oleicola]